jgi:carboxypeptidase Q
MRKLLVTMFTCIITGSLLAQGDAPDAAMVQKIRNEGLNHSQVMETAFYLTEASGPRLNNSPGYMRAANWAKTKLTEWGLTNAQLESWGDWGKGWELQRFYLAMTAPYYKPIIAFPKTWISGTKGLKSTEVILVTAKDSLELASYKGKLKGKLILLPRTDTLKPTYIADASRRSDEDLKRMAEFVPGANTGGQRRGQGGGGSGRGGAGTSAATVSLTRLRDFAKEQGAIALLSTSTRGRDGTLFVQGGGLYAGSAPENFPDIMLAYEDYMMFQRLAQHNIPVKLEVDIKTQFYTTDLKGYNVVAEIKGTDPKLKEELVMLGGHLDSWHGSVGATDNAAGCAVMMEVVRILQTLNVQPRRTIRIALWGGEEQGLHGSRNYVRNHFTDTATRKYNSEGDKLSVYFNLDNGSGKVRGVYLQGNADAKPVFAKWLEPFSDLGASTVTLQNTGGTDHLSFDAVGLPGFQFIQDEIEYNTRTHHTNMDSYDHLQPDDLKQAATVIASFIYHAAMREEKIPRKK